MLGLEPFRGVSSGDDTLSCQLSAVGTEDHQSSHPGADPTFAGRFSHGIQVHGQSIAEMGENQRQGLLQHGRSLEAAGGAFSSGMTAFGQHLQRGAELHGSSLASLGYNHHAGLAAHGQGVAAAGKSLDQGMTLASENFSKGFADLGKGFADLGWYISLSVALMTFALISRFLVDFGFIYIVGLLGLIALALLFSWNLRLHASLARKRATDQRVLSLVKTERQKAQDAGESARKLQTDLAAAQTTIAEVKTQQTSLGEELAKAQDQLRKTEEEREQARLLCGKMSNELTVIRSKQQPSFNHVQKEIELAKAHEDLQRLKEELTDARIKIMALEVTANDPCKRRRSA